MLYAVCTHWAFLRAYSSGARDAPVPERCPACGGATLHRCPACNAPFSSVFAVECEECAAPLRPAELLGVPIRRKEKR